MGTTYTNGGKYKGRIVKWGLGESKEKKTPQLSFVVHIEREVAPDGTEYDCPTYERTIYRYITDATVERLVDDLRRLGYEGESFDQLHPDHPQAHSFEGQEVRVYCKFEQYQNQDKEKFEFDFGTPEIKNMEKAAVSQLNAKFGAMLKATARPAAEKAPPSAKAKPSGRAAPASAKAGEEVPW